MARVTASADGAWKIPAVSCSELLDVQRTPCLLLPTSLACSWHLGSQCSHWPGPRKLGEALGGGGLASEEREVLGLRDLDKVPWPGWTYLLLETHSATNLVSQTKGREPSKSQGNQTVGHLDTSACSQASAESSQPRFWGVRIQADESVGLLPTPTHKNKCRGDSVLSPCDIMGSTKGPQR